METHQAHMPSKLENSLVFPVCSKCNLISFSILHVNIENICLVLEVLNHFLYEYDAQIYKNVCHKH